MDESRCSSSARDVRYNDGEAAGERLAQLIKSLIGISAEVKVAHRHIERSVGKAKRVDKRPGADGPAMAEAFICDAVRTRRPLRRRARLGATDDLARFVKALLARHPVSTGPRRRRLVRLREQAGEDNACCRMAALLAGVPVGVAARRSTGCAARARRVGSRARDPRRRGGARHCGGVESMSRAPFVMAKATEAFSARGEGRDTTIGWRFVNR